MKNFIKKADRIYLQQRVFEKSEITALTKHKYKYILLSNLI